MEATPRLLVVAKARGMEGALGGPGGMCEPYGREKVGGFIPGKACGVEVAIPAGVTGPTEFDRLSEAGLWNMEVWPIAAPGNAVLASRLAEPGGGGGGGLGGKGAPGAGATNITRSFCISGDCDRKKTNNSLSAQESTPTFCIFLQSLISLSAVRLLDPKRKQ